MTARRRRRPVYRGVAIGVLVRQPGRPPAVELAWLLLFRPTPRFFHAWRRLLLRMFGATGRPRRARLRRRENLGAVAPGPRPGSRHRGRRRHLQRRPDRDRRLRRRLPRRLPVRRQPRLRVVGLSADRRADRGRAARMDRGPGHRPHGRDGGRGLRDRRRQRGDARHAGVDGLRRRAVPADSSPMRNGDRVRVLLVSPCFGAYGGVEAFVFAVRRRRRARIRDSKCASASSASRSSRCSRR